MSAELAARITAALAVLGDFRRAEGSEFSGQQPRPDWMAWAQRLAWALTDVLTEAGKASALTAEHLVTIGQALADAATYRDPSGACPDCEAHPAGLCEDHAADFDKTDAYLQLAKALGIEVER